MRALQKILCTGLLSGNPNCICVDVEVSVESVIPKTITLTGGWDAPVIRVAELPPPPEWSTYPHVPNTSGFPAPVNLAAGDPEHGATPTRNAYSEAFVSPGQIEAPGPAEVPETVPPPLGLSPGTGSPTPILSPNAMDAKMADMDATAARFGGRIYESMRHFRSAPAPRRQEGTSESYRPDTTVTMEDVQDPTLGVSLIPTSTGILSTSDVAHIMGTGHAEEDPFGRP